MGVATEATKPVRQGEDPGTPSIPVTIDLVFEDPRRVVTRAYGMAYQLLGRRTEAEDVAQETPGASVRALAENPLVRRGMVGTPLPATSRSTRGDATGDSSTRKRPRRSLPDLTPARVDLHRALNRLSRRQREVLVLVTSLICPKPMSPKPSGVRSAR